MTQLPDPATRPSPTEDGHDHHHGPAAGTGSVFDAFHPPSDERIDDCVHCGFCLPTCPTYVLEGNETNSPRGRIYLMKLGKAGEVPMDAEFVRNFDACLGCMACVTACPSGVKYDELIEAVRPQIERNWERTRADKAFRTLIFSLFPYPSRLRPAAFFGTLYQRLGIQRLLLRAGLLQRLPKRLQALDALLPPLSLAAVVARQPTFTPAVGERRRRVGMLSGCVQRVFFGDVNAAATRVLAAEGCDVVAPAQQRCCGALSSHAGREEEAVARAKALIDSFADADVENVVVNVAGCGSSMKEYGHLLRDDPEYAGRAAEFSAKVRDVSELLHELGPVAERHPVPARVAYHDACHLGHAQKITAQPRAVLRGIPEMTVVDIPETEICCGSAGIYNLVQPEPAEELGRRKVAQIGTTSPDAVVTANAGCLLQIRRYLDAGVPLFHPVQLVDASIRGVDPVAAARASAATATAGSTTGSVTGPATTAGTGDGTAPGTTGDVDFTLGTGAGTTGAGHAGAGGAAGAAGAAGATTGAMASDIDSGGVDATGAGPIASDPFGDERYQPDEHPDQPTDERP